MEKIHDEILQFEIQVSGVHTGGNFPPRKRNEEGIEVLAGKLDHQLPFLLLLVFFSVEICKNEKLCVVYITLKDI